MKIIKNLLNMSINDFKTMYNLYFNKKKAKTEVYTLDEILAEPTYEEIRAKICSSKSKKILTLKELEELKIKISNCFVYGINPEEANYFFVIICPSAINTNNYMNIFRSIVKMENEIK